MAYDYRNMSFKQALALAWDVADEEHRERTGKKLTREAVANSTSIGVDYLSRVFSFNDEYYPSQKYLPTICKALGNTIIVDHLRAQVADMLPTEKPMDNVSDVAQAVVGLGAQVGCVCSVAQGAMEDGHIEPAEAGSIMAELVKIRDHADNGITRLAPVAEGHIYKNGRVSTVTVPVQIRKAG